MPKISSIRLAFTALRELSPSQLGLYTWYQIGLRSGYLRWKTRGEQEAVRRQLSLLSRFDFSWLNIPEKEAVRSIIGSEGQTRVIAEADEIVAGKVRLFGGPPVPLELSPTEPLKHWTAHVQGFPLDDKKDIKWIWEPGRFGWMYTLARAYLISEEEKYPQALWKYTEDFLDANPPNMGPYWISAQEVALRLMAFTFASKIISHSSQASAKRLDRLAEAIAAHAERIPPTTVYSRAQNNNHLLTEAAGLLTASLALPEHPQAHHWNKIGWYWLNHGLQNQIAPDGSYVQHSTNYHRLMLQTALWTRSISRDEFPAETRVRLSAATHWLLKLVDPETGQIPNLGPNDSAYIFPFTVCSFHDFRPVLQAASRAFLNTPAYPPGPWDEMTLWFGIDVSHTNANAMNEQPPNPVPPTHTSNSPIVLRGEDSWAYLRVAKFKDRPGHADQLHLDLWWRGLNIAPDAGTYLYNAEPPWDNALSCTSVHNTVTIEGQDQMRRAGRFLWLDWAQGEILNHQFAQDGTLAGATAQHDGYRRLGATHQRAVEYQENSWIITDTILQALSSRSQFAIRKSPFQIRLHWLLPDLPWEVEDIPGHLQTKVRLDSIYGWITLKVILINNHNESEKGWGIKTQLCRAGELIYGEGSVSPIRGWVSRNYGYKKPALSLSIDTKSVIPLTILTEWKFPQ